MVFLAPPSSVILKGFNTGFIPVAIFSLLLVYSAFQSGLAAARISSGRLSERAWRHFFFFKGKKGSQAPIFFTWFTLGHLANSHRSEHAPSHFTYLPLSSSVLMLSENVFSSYLDALIHHCQCIGTMFEFFFFELLCIFSCAIALPT